MVRRTGDRLIAALDREGLFASNNLFVGLPRPDLDVPLEYIEAWLNSSQATWCFRAVSPRAGRLFAELKLKHLNRLPVPLPGSRARTERVVRLGRALQGGAANGAREALDEAFARIVDLTPEQARTVERHIDPRAYSL